MASGLPVTTSQFKNPDQETIKEMVRIYQEAYKNDGLVQLTHVIPEFMDRMAETIADRVTKPECEFVVARTESSNKVVGWLALAFKFGANTQLSEEHVLLTQYALLPDLVAKGMSRGLSTDVMKDLALSLLKEFKDSREKQLPEKHCILSTLVVDPEYQCQGVASALLHKAISLTEVFSFPIWVQAPGTTRILFEKYSFQEVDEYSLDLNAHFPEPDGKGKGKGKTTAPPPLPTYVWKYMVRKEPLEPALLAYRSSKVFAEEKAAEEAEKALLEKKKAKHRPRKPLLGKGVEPAKVESAVVPSTLEAAPSTTLLTESTPLLADSSSKGARSSRAKGKELRGGAFKK